MNDFTLDLNSFNNPESISEEEFNTLKNRYFELKKKVEEGEELTLEEQRDVIKYVRADRETKFVLKEVKEKEVKAAKAPKGKKLSRVRLIELLEKELAGEELTEQELLDKTRSLSEYKPKKLTNKAMNIIFMKEHEGKALNEVEKLDQDFTLS